MGTATTNRRPWPELPESRLINDELESTVLRFEFEPGRVEWVAFNPERKKLQLDSMKTEEPLVYNAATD